MNVVFCFSPNWLDYVMVSVFAMMENNPPPIKAYLITDSINPDDIKIKLRPGYEIKYIDASETFTRLITSEVNISKMYTKYTLYRLLIPYLIPDAKVLYIDADTLVMGDITDLYNIDLGDNLIAGCIDTGIAAGHKGKIGLPDTEPYYNAGVLLINLALLKQLGLDDKSIELANNKWYLGHDQDILNILCQGRKITVDNKYNSSLSTGFGVDMRIIHYAGGKKQTWVDNLPYGNVWREWEQRWREAVK